MSDQDPNPASNVESHTLAYLRQIDGHLADLDKRFVQIVDIMSRQQTRLDRIQRDIREGKSDMIVMENNILNHLTEGLATTSRLNSIDERLGELEAATRNSFPA